MEFCSAKAYIPKQGGIVEEPKEKDPQTSVDTNVISVKFGDLQAKQENILKSDPVYCNNCKSILSFISRTYGVDEYRSLLLTNPKDKNKIEIEEEVKDQNQNVKSPGNEKESLNIDEFGGNNRIWICEFCGEHNHIKIMPEAIPKEKDIFFLLKSSDHVKEKSHLDTSSEETVIFAIDNSGSTGETIKGKTADGQKKFVTRKQCVEEAINAQLSEMIETFPN